MLAKLPSKNEINFRPAARMNWQTGQKKSRFIEIKRDWIYMLIKGINV